jgi:hypothetical protein
MIDFDVITGPNPSERPKPKAEPKREQARQSIPPHTALEEEGGSAARGTAVREVDNRR